LPLVPECPVATVEEAVVAADEIGYPVVVKTAQAGVHKTESGGVAIDLRDSDAVREAAQRIGAPLLIQPMVRSGVEVLVGAVQDPMFGPLIALGPGGTLAELIGDAAFRLTPLTDYDAQELVRTGKAGDLLAGFRGATPADREAVEDLLLRVSQLAEDLPEVAELDLNPVFAGPSGCVIVDARVRIGLPQSRETFKTW
jgi:acyl-CoA synthetase (NDP forming)